MMSKLRILLPYRTFKNFGHKRQPVARITTAWHGFLTFTFIGLGLEWKRIANFFLGKNDENTAAEEPTNEIN